MKLGTREVIYHLLDGIARSHKHVCRTVFAGEVMAAVAAADDLIATSLSLHETLEGPAPSADAKRPLAEGPGSFHTVLSTDIMSMVSALTASAMRVPREKGLTIHMFWMKEQLLRALITTLQWLDTRDISCDGHTKGTVDRTMLKDLNRGHGKPRHPTKE